MTDGTDTPAASASPAAQPAAPAAAAPAARQSVADSVYQRLQPSEQQRYASIRNPDGGSEWISRDQLSSASDSPSTAPADPAKPADPNARHKFGEMEFSEQELREFLTAKGEAELRKATLPATPNDYVPALPENFKLPDGVDFKVDAADPMLADARNWAHSRGMDQSAFSELIGIYATSKAKEQALYNTAAAAEVAKLGANGVQRVSAIDVWLRGQLGDDLAAPVRSVLVTEKIVRAWETVIQKFQSQGVASFSQAHREPGNAGGGRVSDEQYAKMTSGERLDYARGFDQSQFQSR
jgi:hypothetical protein